MARFEVAPRDDRSSTIEPTRVEHDRDTTVSKGWQERISRDPVPAQVGALDHRDWLALLPNEIVPSDHLPVVWDFRLRDAPRLCLPALVAVGTELLAAARQNVSRYAVDLGDEAAASAWLGDMQADAKLVLDGDFAPGSLASLYKPSVDPRSAADAVRVAAASACGTREVETAARRAIRRHAKELSPSSLRRATVHALRSAESAMEGSVDAAE